MKKQRHSYSIGKRLATTAVMAGLFSVNIWAGGTAEAAGPVLDTGNTAWMIMSTVLVLLMSIPGIALFYGGLVRQKNVLSIIMQTMLIVGVISLLWVGIGYSWAFGTGFKESGNPLFAVIGGFDKAFLAGITPATLTATGIPELVYRRLRQGISCRHNAGHAHRNGHSRTGVCHVSVHVRLDHTGTDTGCFCRKDKIQRLYGVHHPLDHIGLFPHGSLGMGRRLPARDGRH